MLDKNLSFAWRYGRPGMPTAMLVKDRPGIEIVDDRQTKDDNDLSNDHNWPQSLCGIEVSPGKFACNCADTKGLEPEPQTDIHGLAVFVNEASATVYMGCLNGLSGTVVPKSFDECRQLAIERPKLHGMFLMDGNKIRDIIYVR